MISVNTVAASVLKKQFGDDRYHTTRFKHRHIELDQLSRFPEHGNGLGFEGGGAFQFSGENLIPAGASNACSTARPGGEQRAASSRARG
jgi:hypothetical protein